MFSMSFNSKLVRLEVDGLGVYDRGHVCFNSKLVRLEVIIALLPIDKGGCFNSKLVRLEGFPNTALILYWTLTVPVKLIFIFSRFK